MDTDLITMIGNLGRSLASVQHLVSGMSYVLGIILVIKAIEKYRMIVASSRSHEKLLVPTAYLLGGAMLLFLPSAINMSANTVFGVSNVLQYSQYSPFNFMGSMKLLISTAGLIWFVRGCVLLVHASEPGTKDGPKGLTFLIAGILAINLDKSIYYLTWLMNQIITYTLTTPAQH